MRSAVLAAVLALCIATACSDDGEGDAMSGNIYAKALSEATGDFIRPAIEARLEADSFLRSGRPEAARESLVRAFEKASNALSEPQNDGGRRGLLNFLGNTADEIGKLGDTPYLQEAVYHANLALTEGLDFARPWINKASAYWVAGMLDETKQAFRMLYDQLEPADREQIVPNLIGVHYDLARRALMEDRIGAGAAALQELKLAWRLRPDAAKNPLVFQLRGQILEHYEARANRVQDDPLELAMVHANFGFAEPAGASALREAEEKLGRSLEVRWVEARYIEEMHGSDESVARESRTESLESAARHYRRMLARGERVSFAVAGLCRVLRMLGRGEDALREFGGSTDLIGEVREILTLLRIDRIEAVGGEDPDAAKREFEAVSDLVSTGLAREIRDRLLVKVALVALNVEDAERVAWVISKLQGWDPTDPRIAVLNGELRSLKERTDG